MLEQNTFRYMMLIGGVMSLAVILVCFFTLPVLKLEPTEKQAYEAVMDRTLEGDSLTSYQAIMFSLEGKTRGAVSHY